MVFAVSDASCNGPWLSLPVLHHPRTRQAFLKTSSLLTLIATLSLTAPALAEDGTDATPAELAQQHDAAVDRGFLTAHAETIGKGQWAINAYDLVFLGLTYGFTDDIQVSLSTLLPITTEIPLVLALQPKFVLMRSDDTVVSLRTPLAIANSDGETLGVLGAGVLLDQYLDRDGRFALHAGLLVAGAFGDFSSSDFEIAEGALFELDLGASLAVASILKIIIEVQLAAGVTKDGFELADGALVNYGVRFFSGGIAGDLGFTYPVGVDVDELVLGIPYLAFSARF